MPVIVRVICHGDAIQIRTGLILISPPRKISVGNITQTQNPPTSFLFDNDDDDDIDEDSHDSIDNDDGEGVEKSFIWWCNIKQRSVEQTAILNYVKFLSWYTSHEWTLQA